MMSIFSRKPANLGVVDGRLADCPSSPNCVATQAGDGQKAEAVEYAMDDDPSTEVAATLNDEGQSKEDRQGDDGQGNAQRQVKHC